MTTKVQRQILVYYPICSLVLEYLPVHLPEQNHPVLVGKDTSTMQHMGMHVWNTYLSICPKNHPNVGKYTIPGWWYTYPSEKNDFVSWDDYSIPN